LAAPTTWKYFDENKRRKWQNPEQILEEAGLKSGMIFMDIGCGNGFFTLPAARAVGEKGLVYALDSSASAINEIKVRAEKEGLHNIKLSAAKAEEQILCQACADLVFFGIVLHDFQDPPKVLRNAHKMLKPGGVLADLDWKKREMPMGPPVSIRFDEPTASRLIEAARFTLHSVKDWGEFNYLILASA
jgi:ubiquinone/menaquinone biosynthesis C-methylase UbiE